MRRFRFGDFFSRMWLEYARRPRSFPLAVLRKRFLAPEWVFIFGMADGLLKQNDERRPRGRRRPVAAFAIEALRGGSPHHERRGRFTRAEDLVVGRFGVLDVAVSVVDPLARDEQTPEAAPLVGGIALGLELGHDQLVRL